jgi:hypothetical protein
MAPIPQQNQDGRTDRHTHTHTSYTDHKSFGRYRPEPEPPTYAAGTETPLLPDTHTHSQTNFHENLCNDYEADSKNARLSPGFVVAQTEQSCTQT